MLVVDCPEEVALARLVEQRGMDEADARRRMSAQASRADRLAAADFVIHNDGSLADLEARGRQGVGVDPGAASDLTDFVQPWRPYFADLAPIWGAIGAGNHRGAS